MDIREIDKNFDTSFTPPEDIEWHSVRELPFSIHGVFYSEDEGVFRRMPREIDDAINERVSVLSRYTSGGRVRFATDSPYIAVRVEEPFVAPVSHMTMAGKYGLTVFADSSYKKTIMPSYEAIVNADASRGGDGKIVFDGISRRISENGETCQIEIFMPLYSSVSAMYVGVKKGCVLKESREYKYKKPMLFYGSSITQGACASKPGDDYVSRLSRMLDSDFINLGFSGSARAERVIAEYIADQDVSVFVLDYDHNASELEYLSKTHFSLYETVRGKNPDTPIIMMTMPTVEGYQNKPQNRARRDIIFETIERAKALGDSNVYLVDCYGCFGECENGECGTVDGTHPDSLGFLRMAERVYPVLNKIL